jgi:hypothetical protein
VLKAVTLSLPRPPSPETFWSILNEHDVPYTVCHSETRCHLHDNGPVWQLRLDNVVARMATLSESDRSYPDLQKEKLVLEQ